MKLKRIVLQNFRCFKYLEVGFECSSKSNLTVLVADNGVGKTAILEAIATGFGRLLTKLPKVGGIAPRQTDIRIEQGGTPAPFTNVLIEAETETPKRTLSWTIHKNRDNTARTAKAVAAQLSPEFAKIGQKQLDTFAVDLTEKIDNYASNLLGSEASGTAYFLPVIAYYGTDRAVLDEPRPKKSLRKNFNRFDALSGALQGKARFNAAIEWFAFMEDAERRAQQERRDFDYRLPALETVRQAITRTLLGSFSNPRTEIRPFRFMIDRMDPDGVTRSLGLDQLSDGYRIMLALIMDLARRMAQANSLLAPGGNPIANPLDLPAIVLIDEVDLHLHPKWQQTVLRNLTSTFKGTQFIVTTHSPQVLSTVRRENIRVLQATEDGFEAITPDFSPLAHESGDALAKVMGTQREPELRMQDDIRRYEQWVRAGQENSPDARQLRGELEQAGYQFHESDLATWRFLAARKSGKVG